MAMQEAFRSFLKDIEPSKSTKKYVKSVQENLRDYLKSHTTYKSEHKETFLTGSYAKNTCIRTSKDDDKKDVDIVIIINNVNNKEPSSILRELKEVLVQKTIYEDARIQSRSVGIEMSDCCVDVVPIIEKDNKYYVADGDKNEWVLADPKAHKRWASEVNAENNLKFKPLVKVFKWWRKEQITEYRLPKGIVLEVLIEKSIANNRYDTENMVFYTMENLVNFCKENYLLEEQKLELDDPCVIHNNLLTGYKKEGIEEFVRLLVKDIELLKKDNCNNDSWRNVLGDRFPKDTSINEEEKYFEIAKQQTNEIIKEITSKSANFAIKEQQLNDREVKLKELSDSLNKRESELEVAKSDFEYDKSSLYSDEFYRYHWIIFYFYLYLKEEEVKRIPKSFWEKLIKEFFELKDKSTCVMSGYDWKSVAYIYYCMGENYKFNDALCNMVNADGEITEEEIKRLKGKWYLRERLIGCLTNAIDRDYKLKDKYTRYIKELINVGLFIKIIEHNIIAYPFQYLTFGIDVLKCN